MNRKGQVLALFALLIPLFIMCVALIIDTGILYIEKRHVDAVVKDVVEYGTEAMDSVTEKDLYNLLDKNLKNMEEKKVVKKDGILRIDVVLQKKSIFSFLFGKDRYEIKSIYKGMIEQGSIRIVRG